LKNPYTGAVIAEQALETFASANAKFINALIALQAWAKTAGNPPTLITGVTTRMRVMYEEAFGPVLPVAGVANDEEDLGQINHPLFGLTTSVFTHNPALQERILEGARSGTVDFNWCNDVHPEVAWSGWGRSGNGMAAMSELGFQSLTRAQSIVKALPCA
jgi:acyl-CoA reductase-like NAD-dependent aldehyde dehydrogenase